MSELRQASRPLALGLGLLAVALLDAFTLTVALRSQQRLEDRAGSSLREAMLRLRPRLEATLAPGGASAWRAAADEAFRLSSASSAVILDPAGSVLAAFPPAGASAPSPGDAAVAKEVRSGEVMTLGPAAGDATRVRAFLALPSGDRTVVVGLSAEAGDLGRDAHDRRQILVAHAATGAILLLVLAVVSLPSRQPGAAPHVTTALEAAMHELQVRDERVSRLHRAEVDAVEGQLRDLSALARAAELTAGVAHEVRNGLGTILGYARLLERGSSPSDTAEAARSIVAECDVLEKTIRRFMEFAKTETLSLGRVDLGRMLSRVAGRETRGSEGLEVALDTSQAGDIVGDEALLERAFENLVRNAREAAGPGGHVWVAAQRRADSVVVSIGDDGPGLPPDQSKLLRPFATTKAGGLGLGLPLAMKIVQLHRGHLSLAPRSPRGVVAEVTLPVEAPQETGQTAT